MLTVIKVPKIENHFIFQTLIVNDIFDPLFTKLNASF